MKRILFFVSALVLMLAAVAGCTSPKLTKVVKYTAIETALKKVVDNNCGRHYSLTDIKREQLRRIASPILDSMLRNSATYSDLVFNFTGNWKYTDERKKDKMRVEFVAKSDLFHDFDVVLYVYVEMPVDAAAAISGNVNYKFLTGRFATYTNEIQSWREVGYKETVRLPFVFANGVIME